MGRRLDAKTYTVTEKAYSDSGKHVIEVLDPPKLPREWSLGIGDIAFNLRASLDYMAWQLALLNTRGRERIKANKAGKSWPPGGTQFPIVADISTRKKKKAFENRLRPFLARHQSRIRREQPYQRRGNAQTQPLWLLHELRNVDAHRVLHTIVPRVQVWDEPLHRVSVSEGGRATVEISEHLPHRFQELNIPPVDLDPGDSLQTTLKVEANLATRVAFDEPGTVLHDQEILPLLDRIRVEVQRVLNVFADDIPT